MCSAWRSCVCGQRRRAAGPCVVIVPAPSFSAPAVPAPRRCQPLLIRLSLQDVLASGGEDRTVSVWHLGRPAGHRIFSHVGHRSGKVVDFQWCEADPWSLLSVSDDTEAEELETGSAGGGGEPRYPAWRSTARMPPFILRVAAKAHAHVDAHLAHHVGPTDLRN